MNDCILSCTDGLKIADLPDGVYVYAMHEQGRWWWCAWPNDLGNN